MSKTDKKMILSVFGLQRSGNHMLINWLIGLEGFNPLFFNYVKLYESPVKTFVPVSVPKSARVLKLRENGEVVNTGVPFIEGGGTKNGNILCSYENINLDKLDIVKLNKSLRNDFGEYDDIKRFVLVRNPLNFFESYRKKLVKGNSKEYNRFLPKLWKDRIGYFLIRILDGIFNLSVKYDPLKNRHLIDMIELWKTYARIALNRKSITRGQFIPVIYDKFLLDVNYRDSIAQQLGFENHDNNMEFVSDAGGGSSFNEKSGRPEVEEVLLRWQNSKAVELLEPYFRNDYEFHDLCRELFPAKYIEPVIKKRIEERLAD